MTTEFLTIEIMFTPDLSQEEAIRFSRFDEAHFLSPFSPHSIQLDNLTWSTSEHYLQSNLAGNANYARKIKAAPTPKEAHKMGNVWYRPRKSDWKSLRKIYMTRALYTKVQMYPEVAAFLEETGEELIVESSAYDHYWGVGRDQRGENMLGKIWMDIREKIRHKTQ